MISVFFRNFITFYGSNNCYFLLYCWSSIEKNYPFFPYVFVQDKLHVIVSLSKLRCHICNYFVWSSIGRLPAESSLISRRSQRWNRLWHIFDFDIITGRFLRIGKKIRLLLCRGPPYCNFIYCCNQFWEQLSIATNKSFYVNKNKFRALLPNFTPKWWNLWADWDRQF